MTFKCVCLQALLALSIASGAAASQELVDLQVRYPKSKSLFVLNSDGTALETHEWSMTVLKDTAVEWAKRTSITYSTSAQEAEILAAYTTKPDGRRIDASKDNYQIEVNKGRGKDSPIYSDMTTLTILFPDVGVGDTVTLSYRLAQTEPLFPGHFSIAHTYSGEMAFDDLSVRIDYPASLWVQYAANGMKQTESQTSGRKVVEWTYANGKPIKSTRKNHSVYDPEKEVGFAFSTFKTYREIAAGYGARALPKAVVTKRIQRLANEITKGTSDQKDQARALYEWVARNITYGGNCIGIGAVVPRDLAFVLDNKIGDCKDHATLLQALLAARGIKSTQALVNAGAVYRLPKIPVVSTVNHVINYLPAFDLFVDSTSNSTPFGMLPYQDQDKPALLVEGFRDGVRTPVPPIGTNQQRTKSNLRIANDGSISGSVEVHQKGESAVQSRAWARMITKEWEVDFVKNMFLQQGQIGTGKLYKDDPTALTDAFSYRADLKLEKFIKFPGAGAFYIYPLLGSDGAIQNFLGDSLEPEKEADVTCSSATTVEEYEIELPDTMKVLSIPEDLSIADDFLRYTATYRLVGNVLTVGREIDDRTVGNVCSPDVFVRYKAFGEKVMDDLKSQVLYK